MHLGFRFPFSKKFIVKLSVILVLLLFSTSIFSIVFSSYNLPQIDFTSPSSTHEYQNETNADIEIRTDSSIHSSCFIDWNQSLVGYWNFENYLDGTFTDNSTYLNNASLVNRYRKNITDGKFGNGFYFNGSSDQYLNCGNNRSLNITDELTMEAWIKEFETTYEKTFEKTPSSSGCAHDIQQTNDGGYIVTGYTYESDISGKDVWLLKLDNNGNEEWNKKFDCNEEDDMGYSVKQTSDGGYIIVGSANESVSNSRDLWLIKTNSTGFCDNSQDSTTWNFNYGLKYRDDQGFWVEESYNNDGYIITGRTTSFGVNKGNKYNLWLLKTDLNGDIPDLNSGENNYPNKFNRTYGGEYNDVGRCVKQLTDGTGYIVAGYTKSYGNGNYDVWLLKTNKKGYSPNINDAEENNKTMFNLTYGGNKDDRGYYVDTTEDEGYIFTGYTDSYGTYDNTDVWLLKTNESGETIDKKKGETNNLSKFNVTISGPNIDCGRCVKQTTDDGYIIVGYTNSIDETDYDVLLIKTNSTGITTDQGIINYHNNTFNLTFGADGSGRWDRGYSVQETSDGGFIFVGNYSNTPGELNEDLYIIKTDSNGNINGSNNNQSLYKTIVGKSRSTYQLELHNGTIICYINEYNISSTPSLYQLNQQWNHIVITFNITSGDIKLYLNGELTETKNIELTSIPKNTINITIGKNFSGIIDEVRIWNRTLSYEEINNSYNCTNSFIQSHQNLEEATYPYKAHIIDSFGNENTTITRNITIDTTNPIITDGPSSSTTSGSATITWTTNEETNATVEFGIESYTYNYSSDETKFETSHSETIINLLSGQTYHYRVNSYDRAGNMVNSSDKTFTTLSTSGDGDGDADGDEDIILDPDDNTTNTTTDNNQTNQPNVTKNTTQTIIKIGNLSNGTRRDTNFTSLSSLSITRIKIISNNNFTNTSIEIKDNNNTIPDENIPEPQKTDLPDDFKRTVDINNSEFKFRVYNYVDINFKENNTYIKNDIGNVTIEFKVKKTWIKNNFNISNLNDYNKYKIFLLRFNNDSKKWVSYYTNINNTNNETYIFLSANTPGFSTFAVVGSDVVQEGGQTTIEDETQIPWSIIIGFIIAAVIVLIIVLFKAGYIYFEKK